MDHTEMYAHSTMPSLNSKQVESDSARIAEKHVHDSSSVAPSRADESSVLLRSPVMWGLVYMPMLTVSVVVAFMLSQLQPGPGRVPGSGDRGSPNANAADK